MKWNASQIHGIQFLISCRQAPVLIRLLSIQLAEEYFVTQWIKWVYNRQTMAHTIFMAPLKTGSEMGVSVAMKLIHIHQSGNI